MNDDCDPMAELIKIIARDWGGDTVAFYKHVNEMPHDFATRLQYESWANHRDQLQKEVNDLAVKYNALHDSHARLVTAAEAALRMIGPRSTTPFPGEVPADCCHHGRYQPEGGRFHCPECDYEAVTNALTEAKALTGGEG